MGLDHGRTPLGAIGIALALAGCGQPGSPQQDATGKKEPAVALATLPADPGERAATCYAAHILTIPKDAIGVPADRANEAAQVLLLAASTSGITEPSKVEQLQRVAQAVIPAVRQSGSAAGYVAACRAAYPATSRAAAGIGPDDRDTRMQCFALSMAMKQIYDSSPQVQGPSVAQANALFATLDDRMTAELLPGGRGNPAEIAGLATRALAVSVEAGPITPMLDSCAKRYAPAT